MATVSVTLVDPETTTLEVTDNSSGISGVSAPITVSASVGASTTTTTDAGTTSTGGDDKLYDA